MSIILDLLSIGIRIIINISFFVSKSLQVNELLNEFQSFENLLLCLKIWYGHTKTPNTSSTTLWVALRHTTPPFIQISVLQDTSVGLKRIRIDLLTDLIRQNERIRQFTPIYLLLLTKYKNLRLFSFLNVLLTVTDPLKFNGTYLSPIMHTVYKEGDSCWF